MKKALALFLTFAVGCAMLSGCKPFPASASHSTGSFPEEPAGAPSEAYHLTMLTDQWGCSDHFGVEAGCYSLESVDNRSYRILYTDYSTDTKVPLCSSPSCTHSDETCNAWLGVPNCGAAIFADKAHLFIVTFGSALSDIIEFQRIYIANLDGSGRQLLCELSPEETFGRNFAADDHFLYFDVGLTQLNANGLFDATAIRKIDLTTKEIETVAELDDGGHLVGTVGDTLLIQSVQMPEIKTEEDYQKIKNILYRITLTTLEKFPMLAWENGISNVCVSGDSVFSLDLASASLYQQKISDFDTKHLLATLPIQPIGYSIFQYADPAMVVLDAGAGNNIDSRYVISLEGPMLQESFLKYKDGEVFRYWNVLAPTPDGYLVTYDTREVSRTETLSTGDIETFMVRQEITGIITKEDYFSSQESVQPIQDQPAAFSP